VRWCERTWREGCPSKVSREVISQSREKKAQLGSKAVISEQTASKLACVTMQERKPSAPCAAALRRKIDEHFCTEPLMKV
jgi:hypothetical protein